MCECSVVNKNIFWAKQNRNFGLYLFLPNCILFNCPLGLSYLQLSYKKATALSKNLNLLNPVLAFQSHIAQWSVVHFSFLLVTFCLLAFQNSSRFASASSSTCSVYLLGPSSPCSLEVLVVLVLTAF